MRAHCGAGLDGVVDLRPVGVGVTDGHGHAAADDVLDDGGRSGVLGAQREQADTAFGRLLKALILIDAGGADMLAGMSAARTVVGRNPRALDVEARKGKAFGRIAFDFGEIAQRAGDVFVRAGDNGRQQPGYAAAPLHVDRADDLVERRRGRIVVDARETVHLQIDHAGSDPMREVRGFKGTDGGNTAARDGDFERALSSGDKPRWIVLDCIVRGP